MSARQNYLDEIAAKVSAEQRGTNEPLRNYGVKSTPQREAAVALCAFPAGDTKGRADLLDPNVTDTYLIALLEELQSQGFVGERAIEILSVHSDHGDDHALGPHGHSTIPVCSIDIACGDRQGLLQALARSRFAWTVCLGGSQNQALKTTIVWPPAPFYVGPDNDSDHVHVQVANDAGGPGERP